MTPTGHTSSAAAVQRTAILNCLRTAGEEGASVADMVDAGGMWWRTRLEEIRRWKLAVVGEQDDRFYLVSELGVERTSDTEDSSPSAGFEHGPVAGSLSPEPLSLFPSGSSHYTVEAEAA